MFPLMQKYRDVPMDLADASLVTVIEQRRLGPLFTLDSDFQIYRLSNGGAIRVVDVLGDVYRYADLHDSSRARRNGSR